jgi:hypothetical protein
MWIACPACLDPCPIRTYKLLRYKVLHKQYVHKQYVSTVVHDVQECRQKHDTIWNQADVVLF